MHENDENSSSDPLEEARRELYAAENELDASGHELDGTDPVLRRMLKVIERINSDLDIERVLDVAAREVLDIFEAERVFIVEMVSPSELRFRAAVDFEGREIVHPNTEVSHAVIRKVAENREPVLVADATEDPRFGQVSSVQHLELHSVMAAPLVARDDLLGVVYADNRVARGVFDRQILDLLRIFASHVGVALRNAQLFQDLDEARSELAQAERLKTVGQMATYIVHEVKNPLTSIKLLVEMFGDRWQEERVRERVMEVVPREIERLNSSVQQLLEYARPSSLNRVPVSVKDLLDSSLSTLDGQIEEGGTEIITDLNPDLPPVYADGEKLREVFVNLLRNALEAVEGQPNPFIRVTSRRVDRNREEIRFEDNGPGLPEQDVDRLFEPFNTSKESGTGLGLAFCEKLVGEHGGTITAENRSNGGARFCVRLPIHGA